MAAPYARPPLPCVREGHGYAASSHPAHCLLKTRSPLDAPGRAEAEGARELLTDVSSQGAAARTAPRGSWRRTASKLPNSSGPQVPACRGRPQDAAGGRAGAGEMRVTPPPRGPLQTLVLILIHVLLKNT